MTVSIDLPRRFGDYALLRLMGRGGNGSAYVAAPLGALELPELVIVKLMSPEGADRPVSRARFEHEAKLAVTARVPAVAEVYDAGLVGDTPYIAMELVRGMTLLGLTRRLEGLHKRLSLEATLELAASGLRGLQALQEATDELGRALGAIHRDVSPRNLMVDGRGQIRLLDLGLGRSSLSEHHTRTGIVVGTPGYMSPEQVLGAKPTQATDVYSFAVIVWELLAQRRYIEKGSLAEVCRRTVTRVYEPVSVSRRAIPAALDDALRRALSTEPRDRFPNAAELAAAIERVRDALEPSDEESVVSLDEVYAPELSDADVAALLAIELDVTEPDAGLTTVYARRPRSFVPTSGTVTTSMPDPSAASLTAPARDPVFIEKDRGLGPLAVGVGLLALVAATLLGVWIGRDLERRAPPPAREVDAPEISTHAVVATPTVHRARTATVASPSPRAASPTPARAPVERRPAPSSPAIALPRPRIETLTEQVDRIVARGAALKREHPARAKEIDGLLNAAAFEAVAGDTEAARARVAELARRLETLTRP